MKKILLFALALLTISFSSYAKVITKKEVARIFREYYMVEENLRSYKIDKSSIGVTVSKNPFRWAGEFLTQMMVRSCDVYNLHADFYKGKKKYHYSALVSVYFEGQGIEQNEYYREEDDDEYFHYVMELTGASFYRASTGGAVDIPSGTVVGANPWNFWFGWATEKAYY